MPRLLLLLLALIFPLAASAGPPLHVFAAASLTNALNDVIVLWLAQGHLMTPPAYAASSTLAQQIEHGADADLFISADELWMDRLAQDGKIDAASRTDIAGNTLVLVEPRDSLRKIDLKPGADIAGLLGAGGRLAVGDPAHVPAGIYARQALTKLGVWDALKDRLAPADSVRSALLLVERGETKAGIVYATDARVSPKVAVAGVFPEATHEPIRYPAAVVAGGNAKEAAAFLAFLRSAPARDVFAHYGFSQP